MNSPETPVRLSLAPGYAMRSLTIADVSDVQALFDQCADFFVMTDGAPAAPNAAQAEFADVPEGKTPDDVRAFGLIDHSDRLVGTIIGVQGYPDAQTGWIGLMLLAPDQRQQGLGTVFYQAFEQWAAAQGYVYLSLCAIAPNTAGRRFWQQQGFDLMRKTEPRTYGVKTHEGYVYRRAIGP